MTHEGLFEGDFADTCKEKLPLVSVLGQAEGLVCADPGARTPIGSTSGKALRSLSLLVTKSLRSCRIQSPILITLFSLPSSQNDQKYEKMYCYKVIEV